jgi:outer membrane protein
LRYVISASALLFAITTTAAIANPVNEPQASPAKPLGLAQALEYAETNYPSVQAALEEKVAAEKQTEVAKTAYLPQETLLVQINRSTINNLTGLFLPQATIPTLSGPVSPATGQSTFNSGEGVLVTWQPFDFGYRAAAVDAARQAESVATETVSLTKLQVVNAAANAYMNLAAAQSLASVARANVERLQTFARETHVLVSNGLRAGVEAEQADAAEASAQTVLISALGNVDIQRAALGKLVDQPAQDVAIDSTRILESPPRTTLDPRIVDDHPAAKQEAAQIAQQGAQLREIKKSFVPEFDLIGSASARGSGRTATGAFSGGDSGLGPSVGNWALGAQVSLALGEFPSLRAQEAAQRAQLNAERNRYDVVRRDLVEQRLQAQATLTEARKIAAVTPVELKSALQTERQQRIRYQHGLATVVDVTYAEAGLAEATSQDAIARLNVWRALAGVAAAQGDFSSFLDLLRSQ